MLIAPQAVAAGPCHILSGTDLGTYEVGELVTVTQSGSFNSYSGTIAWGDGATTPISGGSGSWSHTYTEPGDYTIHTTGSGSYGDPSTSCSDDLDQTAHITPDVFARIGFLTAPQAEGDFGRVFVHLPIYLHPHSATYPVAVRWRTVDGTARAGFDYYRDSGTVQLSPGTVSVEIIVEIKGDRIAEPKETFNVQITGATNAKIDPDNKLSGVTIADDDSRICPGHRGARVIVGTARDDKLAGTDGRDVICGLGGEDRIYGFDGKDLLIGGNGKDAIYGGKGNDRLDGGAERDKCRGGSGRDSQIRCEH